MHSNRNSKKQSKRERDDDCDFGSYPFSSLLLMPYYNLHCCGSAGKSFKILLSFPTGLSWGCWLWLEWILLPALKQKVLHSRMQWNDRDVMYIMPKLKSQTWAWDWIEEREKRKWGFILLCRYRIRIGIEGRIGLAWPGLTALADPTDQQRNGTNEQQPASQTKTKPANNLKNSLQFSSSHILILNSVWFYSFAENKCIFTYT